MNKNDNKCLNDNNLETVEYLNQFDWEFFVTLAFNISTGKDKIERIMDELSIDKYLIENIAWFIEMASTGMYHVHCVVKSYDPVKALSNASKRSTPDESRKMENTLNYNDVMKNARTDLGNGGLGRIKTGGLYKQFKCLGNVDFRVMDQSRKILCLSYITKNYNDTSTCDIIINSSIDKTKLKLNEKYHG